MINGVDGNESCQVSGNIHSLMDFVYSRLTLLFSKNIELTGLCNTLPTINHTEPGIIEIGIIVADKIKILGPIK